MGSILTNMAFSRKGISGQKQVKCLTEMTFEPTATFGSIRETSPFEQAEHQIMNDGSNPEWLRRVD